MEFGKSSRAALTVVLLQMVLSWAESQAQLIIGYSSSLPQNVPFCVGQPLPTAFSVACQYNSTLFLPNWLVTGLATMSNQIIGPTMPIPPFFPQAEVMGQLGMTVSTLNVTSVDVREGTCFQCELATSSGVFRSKQGCVTAVAVTTCATVIVDSTSFTSIAVSWTPAMLNQSYRISTCREGTSDCPVGTNCTGCSSYEAAGLSPNTSYTVTVDTFISLPNGDCFSQGCSSNAATARTVVKCPECIPSNDVAIQGIIAGVAVGCLSLSLLMTSASVVITFLCTRRCYNKKSSASPPNEKSVYYETVQSDSVQMQPSPAYQAVEQVK